MLVERHDSLHSRTIRTGDGQAEIRFAVDENQVTMKYINPNTSGGGTSWEKCNVDDCIGAAVSPSKACYRHADSDASLLKQRCQLNIGAEIDLRGVEFTEQIWTVVVKYSSRRFSCSGAILPVGINLRGKTFAHLDLTGATIGSSFSMVGCTFDALWISYVDFGNISAGFERCSISEAFTADYAHSDQHIYFTDCTFDCDVYADGIVSDIRFERSKLRTLTLRNARLEYISLENAEISKDLNVDGLKAGSLHATGLTVGGSHIGAIDVAGECSLTSARSTKRVQLEIKADSISLSGAIFEAGGRLDVDGASVSLDRLVVDRRLTIIGSNGASVTSMQNADAGAVTLASMDLSDCIFWGAPNLDEISIESTVVLKSPPGWWRTRRQCVADEFLWRNVNYSDSWPSKHAKGKIQDATASQVAGVYRSLRKSLEGKSDQPGAADFYYGEMEMRRLDTTTPIPEKFVLTTYWLMSGYGLRFARSIALLIAVIVAGAIGMTCCGTVVHNSISFTDGLLVTLEASIPGARTDVEMTNIGRIISLILKIFVPISAALAALAIRNRVRR